MTAFKFATESENIIYQQRAIANQNNYFTFNECSNSCKCQKDDCMNYLMKNEKLKKWKMCIRKVNKGIIINPKKIKSDRFKPGMEIKAQINAIAQSKKT